MHNKKYVVLGNWSVFVLTWSLALVPARLFADSPVTLVQSGSSGLHDITSLDVYVDARTLHLLVSGKMEGDPTQHLRYSPSEDDGETWVPPVQITTDAGPPHHPDPGNSVQIAATGNHLLAVSSITGKGWHDYGPIATALSSDGGKTWRRGASPRGYHRLSDQSFVDTVAHHTGRFHLIWLDDRPDQKRALHSATSKDYGAHWRTARVVDGLTCDCCANKLIATQDKLLVLYRDRDPRDMALATSDNGGKSWRQQGRVGDFSWQIEACAHTGGGLVATNQSHTIHTTVWTGREDRRGVSYLASQDGGRRWSTPAPLGDNLSHHNDIAALNAQHLLAVWDQAEAKHFSIFASRSDDGGKTWLSPWPLRQAATPVLWPRVVATPLGFRVFWLEQQERTTWTMTKIE
jgi:photosystem II stability/assembly factor-like uncharacterized protein